MIEPRPKLGTVFVGARDRRIFQKLRTVTALFTMAKYSSYSRFSSRGSIEKQSPKGDWAL